MTRPPEGEAARLLAHAEHVAAVVRGDVEPGGKAPPASVFRSNVKGRLAYLEHLGRAVAEDLARYDDPAEE